MRRQSTFQSWNSWFVDYTIMKYTFHQYTNKWISNTLSKGIETRPMSLQRNAHVNHTDPKVVSAKIAPRARTKYNQANESMLKRDHWSNLYGSDLMSFYSKGVYPGIFHRTPESSRTIQTKGWKLRHRFILTHLISVVNAPLVRQLLTDRITEQWPLKRFPFYRFCNL